MATLYLSRGIPGSGKTYACRKVISNDPTIIRVSRDDIRFMLYEEYWGGKIDEDTVTLVQYAIIGAALLAGRDVYCDDMNLSAIALDNLMAAAKAVPGTKIEWHDHTDVPLSVCIERDAKRERQVGAETIRSLYERYIA